MGVPSVAEEHGPFVGAVPDQDAVYISMHDGVPMVRRRPISTKVMTRRWFVV